MSVGIYQSAASISALERWQDAVSQNISSSQVSGFKKRTVQFTAQTGGQIQTDSHARLDRDQGQAAIFPRATFGVNFQTGESTPTKRDLDVAIQGPGFFEVQNPDNTKAFTRDGAFHVRTDRTLVTGADQPVLSDAGNPIQLLAQGGDVSISHEGIVAQGGATVGKIGVVTFADESRLVPVGAGLFVPNGGGPPVPLEKPNLLQGHLEGSNITALREMVDLVTIARAYEANQKMITSHDEITQKTLDALG